MIQLSNRGYPMLKTFFDLGMGKYLTQDQARAFDQRPFRSMLVRNYIRYVPNRGFTLTKLGHQALVVFIATDIVRKDPTRPLTAYFDPSVYKLKVMKRTA